MAARLALALFFSFFACACLLWKAVTPAAWCATVAAAAFLPGRSRLVNRARGLLVAVAIALAIWIALFPAAAFRPIDIRMTNLWRKAVDGEPAELSRFDRWAIWTGNIAMGLVGYPLFPEAARETLLLAWPRPADRVYRSDFAMRSHRVRGALAAFARGLSASNEPTAMPAESVAWEEYEGLSYDEARVALAVNCPFVLDAVAGPGAHRRRIDVRGSCRVAYHRSEHMTQWRLRPDIVIRISEATFWALQELRWLRPYTVTYVWSVYSDDPRLKGE